MAQNPHRPLLCSYHCLLHFSNDKVEGIQRCKFTQTSIWNPSRFMGVWLEATFSFRTFFRIFKTALRFFFFSHFNQYCGFVFTQQIPSKHCILPAVHLWVFEFCKHCAVRIVFFVATTNTSMLFFFLFFRTN